MDVSKATMTYTTPKYWNTVNIQEQNKFLVLVFDNTCEYLSLVYPTAKKSFYAMNYINLGKFYNVLTYYYPNVPYSPRGYFYNTLSSALFNIPIKEVNGSNDNVKYFSSSTINPKLRKKIKKYTTDKARILPLTNTLQGSLRMLYFPNGLSKVGGKYLATSDFNVPGLINKSIHWNHPYEWIYGFVHNQWIEIINVTDEEENHFNVVVGSGIFINTRKTLNAFSKLDAYLKLGGAPMKLELTEVIDDSVGYLKKFFDYIDEIKEYPYIPETLEEINNNNDYIINRLCGSRQLYNTMISLALEQKYDTIHLTMDPNKYGWWNNMLIVLYPNMINTLTARDPVDIENDDKAIPLTHLGNFEFKELKLTRKNEDYPYLYSTIAV